MSKTIDVQILKHSAQNICVTMVSMSFNMWLSTMRLCEKHNWKFCNMFSIKKYKAFCKKSKCQTLQIKKLKVVSVSVSPCLN